LIKCIIDTEALSTFKKFKIFITTLD